MRYYKYVIFLIVGILIGCAVKYTPIQYPTPDTTKHLNIVWIKMQHEPNLSCLTTPHAKDLLYYIVDLETEVAKSKVTIEEINKGNK